MVRALDVLIAMRKLRETTRLRSTPGKGPDQAPQSRGQNHRIFIHTKRRRTVGRSDARLPGRRADNTRNLLHAWPRRNNHRHDQAQTPRRSLVVHAHPRGGDNLAGWTRCDARSRRKDPDNETAQCGIPSHFETGPATPLKTSPNPPGQTENKGVTRVAVHLSGVSCGKRGLGWNFSS